MSHANPTISDLLYWIGCESQTASDNMPELCARCGVLYPPGTPDLAALSTTPSAPAHQQEAAHA